MKHKQLPQTRSTSGRLHWLQTLLLAACCILTTTSTTDARVEADPNKDYKITPAEGPWMIIITSYTGPMAPQMARDLVLELRSRYNLPAFSFNRGAEERRKQQEEMEQRRQQQKQFLEQMGLKPDMPARMRGYRIEEQFAVLVGSYKDFDSASKALTTIKKLDPPKSVPLDAAGYATLPPADKDGKKKQEAGLEFINPFRTCFVVHNPLVPIERPQEKPDAFLKELNADESYSLLKTRKPWTLAVKEFHRATVVQPNAPTNFMDKLLGKNDGAVLDAMAKQAHEIAKVLRGMNFDAHVLHTRWGSVVTVGSYDTPNDPQLVQNQRVMANLQLGPTIQMFARPMPMEVPRP